MRNVFKTLVGASAGVLLSLGAMAAPVFAPAQPATLAEVQKFERTWAPGIASALDACGIAASDIAWIRVNADTGGTGGPKGYDAAIGFRGKPGTVMVRLGAAGEPREAYGMHGAVVPKR